MIMEDFDDPLDLLGDDGDGVVEMCLIERSGEKQPRRSYLVFWLMLPSGLEVKIARGYIELDFAWQN